MATQEDVESHNMLQVLSFAGDTDFSLNRTETTNSEQLQIHVPRHLFPINVQQRGEQDDHLVADAPSFSDGDDELCIKSTFDLTPFMINKIQALDTSTALPEKQNLSQDNNELIPTIEKQTLSGDDSDLAPSIENKNFQLDTSTPFMEEKNLLLDNNDSIPNLEKKNLSSDNSDLAPFVENNEFLLELPKNEPPIFSLGDIACLRGDVVRYHESQQLSSSQENYIDLQFKVGEDFQTTSQEVELQKNNQLSEDDQCLIDYGDLFEQVLQIEEEQQDLFKDSDLQKASSANLEIDEKRTSTCNSHYVRKESLSLSDISCSEYQALQNQSDANELKGGGFFNFFRRRLSPKPQHKYKVCDQQAKDDFSSCVFAQQKVQTAVHTQTELTWNGKNFVSCFDSGLIDCRLSQQEAFLKLKQLRQRKRLLENQFVPEQEEQVQLHVQEPIQMTAHNQSQRRSLDWSYVEPRTLCRLEQQFIPKKQGQLPKQWRGALNSEQLIKSCNEVQCSMDGSQDNLEELLLQVNYLLSNVKHLLVKES